MSRFFQHTVFVLRYRYTSNWMSVARKTVYGLLGMRAGKKLALRISSYQLAAPGINGQWMHY
ncbi:MAG: hypothetical protein QM726_03360 [Chitinophagaceae bacterium]